MSDRIYSFMGLAAKAGKLVSGGDACEKAVKSAKALLVIMALDASVNTNKKFTDLCKYRGIEIRSYGGKELIGKYTGKRARSVIAITDINLAEHMIKMLDSTCMKIGGECIG